jgi:hypothetical protein
MAEEGYPGYIEEPSVPTVYNIREFGEKIVREMPASEENLSPQLAKRIKLLVQGINAFIGLHQQLQTDLEHTEAGQSARNARSQRIKRRVTGGGLIRGGCPPQDLRTRGR